MKHFNHSENLQNVLQGRKRCILWLHVENSPQKIHFDQQINEQGTHMEKKTSEVCVD